MPEPSAAPPAPYPVRFGSRFVGPFPGSANGGVIAGTLAAAIDGPADGPVEVRITRPVPLEVDLELREAGVERELVRPGPEGPEVLARAHAVDAVPDAPPHVTPADADRTEPVVTPDAHMAPGCFVCGHEHPTGYRLQPGRVRGRDVVAARWTPPTDVADAEGLLPPPFVWAALDCPSWFGAAGGRMALLGTMRARLLAPVPAGEELVVTGWGTGTSGRKIGAGSALRTPPGDLLAVASALWIVPA